MTEAKKRKLHSAEFRAKVALESSLSRTCATHPVGHERQCTSASRLSGNRVKPQYLGRWNGQAEDRRPIAICPHLGFVE